MEFWLLLILTSLLFLQLIPSAKPVSDYSTFVYKTCSSATQSSRSSDPLDSLFTQLVAQSSHSSFFKTMEMGNDDETTIMSGMFQCREDISREECFRCVNLVADMCRTLCRDSVAGRVQLEGCYTQYEFETEGDAGESEVSDNDIINAEVLHRVCGDGELGGEVLEEALGALESRVEKSVKGYYYYRGYYESVEMMAQCEADMEGCECSECVSDAVQVVKQQCTHSISAQVYLPKCFITYIYHPHANSFPGANKNNSSSTQRLAAIIVGGAAAACVGLIFLFFLKSRYTKDDYD